MDHMDLISCNSDDGFIKIAYPKTIAAENSQKGNIHLGKAMKSDDREDFMKATEKEIKDLTTVDFWKIFPKSLLPNSAQIIQLIWSFKEKNLIWRANQTQVPFICTWWYD